MAKRKKRFTHQSFLNMVAKLATEHKKVRITFLSESDTHGCCACECDDCVGSKDWRRRILYADGYMEMALRSDGHKKWYKTYNKCCFLERYEDEIDCPDCGNPDCCQMSSRKIEMNIKDTLKYMSDHDRDEGIVPIFIEYGPKFSQRINLPKLKWR